jgi:hypothetical protein
MPQTIQCGSCQRHIKLPDGLDTSRQYRCPGCGGALVIPAEQPVNLPTQPAPSYAPPPPSNPLDFDDRGRRDEPPMRHDEPPVSSTEAMDIDTRQALRTGTMLSMIAHGTYLFGLLLTIILFLVAMYGEDSSSSPRRGGPTSVEEGKFMAFIGLLFIIAMMGQFVLALVGQGFWLSAPWKYGARGLACALAAVSLVVLIRQTAFMGLLESVGNAGRMNRGGPGEDAGAMSPMLLIVLEAARLALIAATVQAIGRNVRRNSPPTAGAGLLSLLTPIAILGAFMLSFLIMLFSDPPSAGDGKGKITMIVLLNLFAFAGAVAWGGLSMLMLMSGLGSRGSRRY